MTSTLLSLQFDTGRPVQRAGLIWGQRAIRDVLVRLDPDDTSLNRVMGCRLPAPRSLDEVLAALRRLVEVHDSLHTSFTEGEDGPVQEVVPAGMFPVELLEPDGDPAAEGFADALTERLRRMPFAAGALPVRLTIVIRHGVPAGVVLVCSALAADHWSLAVVQEDLAALLADPAAALPPRAQQPVERQAFESTAAGARRAQRTLDYWRRHLRDLPTPMIQGFPAPPELRWAGMRSTVLAVATRRLAATFRVSTSTVMLALTARYLARATGQDAAALRLLVATRFSPETRRFVGAFNLNALFDLRVADDRAQTLLRTAAAGVVRAYAHCEYRPELLEDALVEVCAERGVTTVGYCFFNDIRIERDEPTPTGPPEPDGPPDTAALAAMLDRTTVQPVQDDRKPGGANFFLYLTELAAECALTLCVERRFLPGSDPASMLRGIEAEALRAVADLDAAEPHR